MHILLNGEAREVADNTTLADLVGTLDLSNRRFAVEINEELVPRSEHATHRLQPDDRIEIVQAIGGG
ncbi:MAG TPA: sulfur carrier protein ThiS [Gammaproteobacteria bacterium]|nr:sulfur carrier protein ThiS [Gammaproteobacteria bacterium]MCP5430222.1 sulfur carrier protein ThiS [Chromatiaceae bacterium]HOP16149.1 sulfur carrier protein ThiS [Gammaproteobacteria bacterium]HPQ25332.1 sulfur carrier protein ThiS [Gammaproteobacteria bacterium]